MSAPIIPPTELQHEADRSYLETTSASTPLPPRPQHAPMNPMSLSQMKQMSQKSQPASPVQSSQPPSTSSPSRPASSSVLPPLSDSRRVSAISAPKMSPRSSFSTPVVASASALYRMSSAGKSSATAPTPTQNGSVSRPSQTTVASSSASSSRAPPSTTSTAPLAVQQPARDTSTAPASTPETPVPVPALPPTPATDVPKPKPAYKMKRTGKPGMPPGIPLNFSVPLASSPSNSPSMTPPPPASAHAQGKPAPKPATSHAHIDNPQPASITSDIAPGVSSVDRPSMNGSAMRPPPKPAGQAQALQPDSRPAAAIEKDKPQPASASQARAGDKRRNPASPDRPQGYGDSLSKRARLETAAVMELLDDDSDHSSSEDSEDAADGEASDDDDVINVDNDEEEGESSSDDENSSSDSSSSDSIPMAAKARPDMTSVPLPAQGLPSVVAPRKHKTLGDAKRRGLSRPGLAANGTVYFHKTPSGRFYNIWIDAFGIRQSASGAILPDGYELYDNVSFPWICPIRSCRVAFSELSGLGHHFSRGHRSTHLNDNLDGTLTIVKRWETKHSIGGARVVSQKRLAEPGPLVTPRLKRLQNKKPMAEVAHIEGPASDGYWSESSELSSMSSMPGPLAEESTPRAWPVTSPKPGDELHTSVSGRSYTKTEDGSPSHGVAFPDGYRLSSYPGHPWVCPVRSCRRVLKALHNLGGHYTRQHRDCLLNENKDGTHSVVGRYIGHRPLVVSHHSIPVAELEPLAAEVPAGLLRPAATESDAVKPQDVDESVVEEHSVNMNGDDSLLDNSVSIDNGGALIPGRHPAQPQHRDLETPMAGDAEAMWQYIEPALKRTSSRSVMEKSYMHLFLDLPRKRDIYWNTAWIAQNPYLDSQPRDIASLVVHLTGDYADEPCNHCKLGKGPYSGCVLVSSTASPGLVAAFDSCANCLYHCGHSYCTLKNTFKPRFHALHPDVDFEATRRYVRSGGFSKDLARGGLTVANRALLGFSARSTAAMAAAIEEDKRLHRKRRFQFDHDDAERRLSSDVDVDLSVSVSERERAKQVRAERKRRSERIAIKDIVDSYAHTPPVPQSTTPIPIPVPGYGMAPMTKTTASRTAATNGLAASSSALIFAGAAQPGPEVLEMEDWEVAPGRVDAGAATVAYSNAYLTSTQMVPIDHNMSYRVQLVQPGSTMAFPSDAASMRTCSIARGKLRVTVGDAQFVIGPNGLFKVLPGVAFSVENRLYIDACIHITSLHV